jgi:sugar/nucleoside kinase (ribokinase family)
MFSRVAALELLTVGEAFDDLIFVGLDRLPRAGEEVKTGEFVQTIGGGAIISAVAAARLGTTVGVVSGLGPAAVARLRDEGVAIRNLRRPGEPHAVSAALSTRSNRTFVTFNGVNDVLESRLPAALVRPKARHVHFAFYPHDCSLWQRISGALRALGKTTSWDFGWNDALLRDRGFGRLLEAVDFVFLNEQEALLYSGRDVLTSALAAWRKHPTSVVIKLGSKGSRWLSARGELRVPAPRIRPVDTTGAGDAFNGGFLAGLLRGLPPERCLALGNFVGAMSTRAAGGLDALPRGADLPAPLRARASR